MAVTKLSQEELAELENIRAAEVKSKTFSPERKSQSSQDKFKTNPEKAYLEKFSDKAIAEFFAPYGYIAHERSYDGTMIYVECDTFQLAFNPFSVVISPLANYSFYKPQDPFFDNFVDACYELGITPETAIEARLTEEIFNKMPYYVETKAASTKEKLEAVKHNSPFKEILTPAITDLAFAATRNPLDKKFGSTDPEKIADTLARLNLNK